MAGKATVWPSKRGPMTKIMPSDACKGDNIPLAVGKWYNFHEFGCHLDNVGLAKPRRSRKAKSPPARPGREPDSNLGVWKQRIPNRMDSVAPRDRSTCDRTRYVAIEHHLESPAPRNTQTQGHNGQG